MNITKFFNLSILEVEKYLDLNTKIFTNKPGPITLTKGMGLTGITNWKFEKDKKIHIVKKANIYRVYSINTFSIKDTTKYWLAFHMSLGGGEIDSLFVKISPKTKTIVGFKRYKEGGVYREAVDKTKKLSDYIG